MFTNLTIRRKLTLFISILLIVTVVSSILVANYVVSNTLKNQALENARNEMHTKVEFISSYLDALRNDVRVLSQSLTLQKLLDAQDQLKTDTSGQALKVYERLKQSLKQDYYTLSNVRKSFMQLRYIDHTGKEVIRVDNNKSVVKIIPDNQLQNKGKNDYFLKTIKNKPEQLYASALNLNKEQGKIEIPYNPVIRYALPIFDKKDQVRGIVIANIYANVVLAQVQSDLGLGQIYLTDQQGYYLYHPNSNKQWGRDLKTQEKLGKDYDQALTKKLLYASSQVIHQDGNFFISTPIYPLKNDKETYWVMLEKITSKSIQKKTNTLSNILLAVGVVVLLLGFLFTYFFSRTFTRPIQYLKKNIVQLMRGEIPTAIDIHNKDEVGEMTQSFNELVHNIQHMASFAKKLGDGEHNTHLEVSSQMVLVDALNKMKHNLSANKMDTEIRKWTGEGLAKFAELLRGHNTMEEVFDELTDEIAKYLRVHWACIYILKDDKLVLANFYGVNKEDTKEELSLRDGLVGQAFYKKEPIYLNQLSDNFLSVSSGTISVPLQSLLIVPLQTYDQTEGVLELAHTKQFEKHEIEFIKELCSAIAVTIASIRNKEHINSMLEQAQEYTHKLETQEEELRQNLEEIAATQENLAHQNTELKKSEQTIKEQNKILVNQESVMRTNMEQLQQVQTELEQRNKEIAEQHKLIQSSINYATNIQKAILPSQAELTNAFRDYFLIYKPKNKISGDFYWLHKTKEKTLVALIDCTGHGVPGGFMSLIGSNLLNQIVIEKQNTVPGEILEYVHNGIRKLLRQSEKNGGDGMVASLCSFEKQSDGTTKLHYSSTKQFIFYHNGTPKIQVLKGERKILGGWQQEKRRTFATNEMVLQPDTTLYLTTDGILDLPNRRRKRLGVSGLLSVLEEVKTQSFSLQKKALNSAIAQHTYGSEQRDDVSILAILI